MHPIELVCAGRTDTGVHAAVQVVHFDTGSVRPLMAWVRGVNSTLPDTIRVNWVVEVNEDFHARFSAITRSYRYLLVNKPVRPAILSGRVGWYHGGLDVDKMQESAALLLGRHDFSAFRAAQCQAKSPVRELLTATVQRHGDWISFDFRANAFLHHMVRNLVGALVHVGRGAALPSWMRDLLEMRNRKLAPPTFSPDGLYLCGIEYPGLWALPNGGDIRAPLFLEA